jgi:hypothetical protein
MEANSNLAMMYSRNTTSPVAQIMAAVLEEWSQWDGTERPIFCANDEARRFDQLQIRVEV